MSKRRGLGKGLAELIPAAMPVQAGEVVAEIPVAKIDANPVQPRRDFNQQELADLAASIKAQGLLQPIIVRKSAGGRYQVVAGERRLRATRDLGRAKIQAIVRPLDDGQLLELALVENLIRSDLNEIEVAEALQRLQNQYGYTTTKLAEIIGKSRPAVSNTLRLLELPDSVKTLVRSGMLTAGHGRGVLSFPVKEREQIAKKCSTEGWSVRELERRSSETTDRKKIKRPRRKASSTPAASATLKRVETRLVEHLGTKVKLTEQGGVGTIAITFHGEDDLDRLLDILLVDSDPV